MESRAPVCVVFYFAGNRSACHFASFSPDVRNTHMQNFRPRRTSLKHTSRFNKRTPFFPAGTCESVFIYHESARESETAILKSEVVYKYAHFILSRDIFLSRTHQRQLSAGNKLECQNACEMMRGVDASSAKRTGRINSRS